MKDQGQSQLQNERASLQELAIRALGGEERAMGEIYPRLAGPLRAFFLKNGSTSTPEELVHQTLAEALQALREGKYQPERAQFSTFAHGYARMILRRHRRTISRQAQKPRNLSFSDFTKGDQITIEEVCGQDDNPLMDLNELEEIEAMRQCLRAEGTPHSLTPEERTIITGRAEGESLKSIAQRLGLPLSVVFNRNRKALQKLRGCMKKKGYH